MKVKVTANDRQGVAMMCAMSVSFLAFGGTLWALMYTDIGATAANTGAPGVAFAACMVGLFIISGVTILAGLITAGLVLYMTEDR